MGIVWNEQIDLILSIGCFLSELGTNNWALDKKQTLEAINTLEKLNYPILGGDVLIQKNGVFEYNYDNWYCNNNLNENDYEFTNRSAEYARQYILNYCFNNPGKYYFTIVPLVQNINNNH